MPRGTSEELCSELSHIDFNNINIQNLEQNQVDEDKRKIISILENDENIKSLLLSNAGQKWLENKTLRESVIHFIRTKRIEENITNIKQFIYDAYINYFPQDIKIVTSLIEILKNEGISIFSSNLISVEKHWQVELNRIMKNTTELIIILSKNSIESELLSYDFLKNLKYNIVLIKLPSIEWHDISIDLKYFEILEVKDEEITKEKILPILRYFMKKKIQ